MSKAIEGLKPAGVWKYFAEISEIPRPSKHEEKIAAYVLATAKKLGLEAKKDRVGNIIVRKPASKGREKAPGLILQGHLDMVPEKNADKKHDFLKDPIELVRKGNFMMANGTTLGADNGIAVATNLAIMADPALEHGPLEFLFTIDEETGLTGASNLEKGVLKYKTLMNLDSEEEGAIYVGCSGGRDTVATWKAAFKPAPANHVPVRISVKGLKGGHSGLEIDKGRGNAIKIINRVLLALGGAGARLSAIDGGNKRNAIPRECDAVVYVPKKNLAAAMKTVAACNSVVRNELGTVEPDLRVSAAEAKGIKKGAVIGADLQAMVLKTISSLPHGVIKMSADIPGLVETSTNVAVINTTGKGIVVATSQRSSVASEIGEICHTVASIFDLGGAKVEQSDGYPGWQPNLEDPRRREEDLPPVEREGPRHQGDPRRARVRHHR
jgi:dipeptidase D